MLSKVKLGPKLIGGFVIVAIITVVVGMIGLVNLRKIGNDNLPSIDALGNINAAMSDIQGAERTLLIPGLAQEKRQEQAKIIEDRWNSLEDGWKVYESLSQSKKDAAIWKQFTTAFDYWKKSHEQVLAFANSDKLNEAYALSLGESDKNYDKAMGLIDKAVTMVNDDGKAAASSSIMVMIVSSIFGFIIALILGILLTFSITKPVFKMVDVANKIAVGDVEQNIDHKSGDEIGILANSFRQMVDYIKGIAGAAQSVSMGDLTVEVKSKSDKDVLSKSFIQVTNTLKDLVTEANTLSKAAVDGKLDTRGDVQKFQGGYREIVQGVNDTLDAVIGPLNVAAEYIDRISKGDVPTKITDTYKGDFNEIKNNLNQCIDAVNLLVADANVLSKAAVEGKLDTRADASKHSGDFRKIVEGVNETLDSVIGPLNVAAEYVDRISKGDIPTKITDTYKGDFNEIKNNLNQCIDAVNLLVADANVLSKAAVEGKLDTRADASKHHGDFQKIVEGVNDTLDAVIKPINEAGSVLAQGAEGDMTVRIKGDYNGQLAELKSSINALMDSLENALSQVNISVSQISSASGQIASGSQSLAEASSEQASSLEEISSSLEELSSMAKQNADNSSQAKNLSQEASGSAKTGNRAMEQMTQAIDKIKTSSDETAKIIKTIDEIAFQTNLLALNAAVEAARAGEAGKGFAVVAEEVRNLAQRSASAAKNTSDLIQQATENSNNGVKISEEVVKTFGEITQSINKVNDLIAEISAASTEQSQGISQINTAVADMDKLTQSSAANSEESASAAQELSAQVSELRGMVSKFRLNGNGHAKTEFRQNHVTSLMSDPINTLIKKEKKKIAGNTGFTAKATKQIPLDDSELAEF